MKPISQEKRADIVRLKQNGKKENEIADWIGVSIGSVRKLWGQFVHTSDISAKKYQGRKSTISIVMDEQIGAKICNNPSITVNELIAEFELNITESGLSKRLKKMGYTFKKRLFIQRRKNEKML